ncbi:MAG: hypothetical protein P9X24_14270, partial [Candidatus Hatepunaea meridiana]|nr:hypothetical protein [Candidatus Hatepunaea meridiana]
PACLDSLLQGNDYLNSRLVWIPFYKGMTECSFACHNVNVEFFHVPTCLDSLLQGNDYLNSRLVWIPFYKGMTISTPI